MRWYLANGGEVVGPVEGATISLWVAQGRVTPGTFICREGDDRWLPFERSIFAAPTPRPGTASARIVVAFAMLAVPVAVLMLCRHSWNASREERERAEVVRVRAENERAARAAEEAEQAAQERAEARRIEAEARARGRERVREHLRGLKPAERAKSLRECFESAQLCPEDGRPDLIIESAPTAAETKRIKALWSQLEAQRERAAAAARRASAPLLCCDGSLSPSCTCGNPKRGCCSHHRGVCGCSE